MSNLLEVVPNRVSIIIPCFNGAPYIEQAINSVLAQTDCDYEIIVVDDGSHDNSLDCIAQFENVQLIAQDNSGCASARNVGWRQSSGQFLVFLDQDDRLMPGALKTGLNWCLRHPECGLVYGRNQRIDEAGNVISSTADKNALSAIYPGYSSYAMFLADRVFVPPAAAMFSREAVIEAGGFKSEFTNADDLALYLEIAKNRPVFCHDKIVVEYRKHKNNTSRNGADLLPTLLAVYKSQYDYIEGNPFLIKGCHDQEKRWTRFFGRNMGFEIYRQIKSGDNRQALKTLNILLKNYPQGLVTSPLTMARKFFENRTH